MPTAFGTILGYHSVAELKDLVAAKDVAMRNLARRFAEVSDSPKLDLTIFKPAYLALVARYSAAQGKAQQAIDDAVNAWRNPNAITAEEEWNGLLTALNPHWKDYTWSEGDGSYEDLFDRTRQAGAKGTYDENVPQPQSGSDIDFNALTATTQITQAMANAGTLVDKKHLILYGILGSAFIVFVLPKLMVLGMPGGMLLRR